MKSLSELAERITGDYRNLVAAIVDGTEIDQEQAAGTLARAQRNPGQLAADVDRLRQRRQAAADVAEAEQLTRDVEAARSRYGAAVANEAAARAALDSASRDARTRNDLEARRALNRARAAVAEATVSRGSAFSELQSATRARDALREPARRMLEDTAAPGADTLTADEFALA